MHNVHLIRRRFPNRRVEIISLLVSIIALLAGLGLLLP